MAGWTVFIGFAGFLTRAVFGARAAGLPFFDLLATATFYRTSAAIGSAAARL